MLTPSCRQLLERNFPVSLPQRLCGRSRPRSLRTHQRLRPCGVRLRPQSDASCCAETIFGGVCSHRLPAAAADGADGHTDSHVRLEPRTEPGPRRIWERHRIA
ncbi:hypothetical protein Q5P01_007124 [Channa striata]|uniref:Uncharacterized protein n=1 Tax=Channa striata TaxID=64152 RepID=A0AA88N459_CHASR|nr:hypothetical protein Q5P01_007124 [Channa striata]